MDADTSSSRPRRDQSRMSVRFKLGRNELWCCAFHQQGRLARLARLFLAERVSRSHRLVCLSDHLHLRCFPELANHVSTTTNLTMMWKKKDQELALFPSQVLHSTQ